MKVAERVLERRLRQAVEIDKMQFGFRPGTGTTHAIFIAGQLQERYRGKHRKLRWAFADLEKAFDRVPRKVVEWAMRKLGVEEWLVRAVMAMYKHARTRIRSFGTGTTQVVGNMKHPCSVCLKGVGVNSIRCTQCVQWVYARCSRVKGSLKKVKSSFICRRCKGELNETRQVNGLHIDGHEYEIVDKFCCLGDMLSQEGGCEHAILKRIQTGWLKFRELSGLLIGKGMSLK